MPTPRVTLTDAARKVIEELKATHGALMFHQSGGCCDGSAPMCYAQDEFLVGEEDIWLGQIADCDFYISRDQFEYWQHTQLIIDVAEGRGSSFSLEIPLGLRFMTKSRLYSPREREALAPVHSGGTGG